jgi:glycosyltransferase involved in cell wall biosynthesis
MRIALTADPEIPVPPVFYGGIERIVDMIIRGLTVMGHEITLFAHPDSKVPCRLVPWKGKASNKRSDTFKNTVTLYNSVIAGNYDLVHSFSRLAYMLPLLPMAIPKIMSYQREPSLKQVSLANRLSKKGTLLFTGCSNYISEQIKTRATAVTVYNGVPPNQFALEENIQPGAPLVFLGRIEPFKGTHIAIEVALKSGRDLVIAGNVPEEHQSYFKDKIQPFLNESIRYIGPVNDVQKNDLLRSAYAFLMPIQWNEPFGIVMAEAMACGTPVLGFPFGSVPEVVTNGLTGFICRDANEMVEKITEVAKLDRSKIRQVVEQKFSEKVIVQEYLEIYQNLLSASKQRVVVN